MFFELFPSCAGVGGAVNAAAGTAAGERPGRAPGFPQRGEQDVGILRIERHVDRTGVLVFVENLVPGLAAVGGAKDAAFCVGSVGVPSAATKAISGLCGFTITLPIARESFRPTYFQDLPASTDFQTPSPFEMLPRMQASPVPT